MMSDEPSSVGQEPADLSPKPGEVQEAPTTTESPLPPEAEVAAPEGGAGEGAAPITEDQLRLAEALVFASAQPVPLRQLAQLLPETVSAEAIAEALRRRYAGRGVELVEAAGGLMFRTAADLAPALRKIVEVPRRLPRAAMETLALIAYHQPVTRAEIEAMRGASLSQQTLDSLLEANLVAPAGHKESPGRPTLWATTPTFLTRFGLRALSDLPRREDLLVEPTGPRAAEAPPLMPEAPEPPAEQGEIQPPPEPQDTQPLNG